MGVPDVFFAPVVIVAVYVLSDNRLDVGVNDAVVPLYETDPGTAVVPSCKVNVDVLIGVGSIATLNVAVTVLFNTTPVSLAAGLVEITVGGVGAKVVNVH